MLNQLSNRLQDRVFTLGLYARDNMHRCIHRVPAYIPNG